VSDSEDFDGQSVIINPSSPEQELHWADFVGTGFMIVGQTFEALARGFQSVGIDLFKAANYGRARREQERYNRRFDTMIAPEQLEWTVEEFRRPGEES
jgi:hypothetical protein